MRKPIGKYGLILGILLLIAPNSEVRAQDVELNPGTIEGTVQVGSETIGQLQLRATSDSFLVEQTLFPNDTSVPYDLTVQVEAGSSRTYRVTADIRTNGNLNRLFVRDREVTVVDASPPQPSTLDFVFDPPGIIEGTVTVVGGNIDLLFVSAQQPVPPFDLASTFVFGSGAEAVDFSFPAVPGETVNCSGFAQLTNGIRIDLVPAQSVTPGTGGPVRCDFTIEEVVPGSIAGIVDFDGPQAVDFYNFNVFGPNDTFPSFNPPFDGPGGMNSDAYSIDPLAPGTYNVSLVRVFLNDFDDEFRFAEGAYSAPRFSLAVESGQATPLDIQACQAFLNGTFEFTGTASLDDLTFGQARARGDPDIASPTRNGFSFDRITPGTGAFDLIVSDGAWAAEFFRIDLFRPIGDPLGYLSERIFLTADSSPFELIDLACGDVVEKDFTIPTGSVTINFTVAGGGVLTNPELRFGTCESVDETTGERFYTYNFDAFSTGQVDVLQGSATFEGPAAVCNNIRARATVAGSLTTFAEIDGLEIKPGFREDRDIGAPTVTVIFPESGLIIDADEITVVGVATDRLGPNADDPPGDVASLTVNGIAATLMSTMNPDDPAQVSFEVTVPLPVKGLNVIAIEAFDIAGNRSTTELDVFNDAAPPDVAFTPANGARTPLDFDIEGTASDDAGIASVVITIDGIQQAVLDGAGAFAFPFTVPASLGAGGHTITVVATDISERSTTVVSMITAAANAPPVAADINVQTNEDTPVSVTLEASDPDNDPLTFTVLTQPQHGMLSGTAPDLTYTPELNFFGPDSFTYSASDGTEDSNAATVAIAVQAVNDTPIADAGPDQTLECTSPEGALVSFDGSGSSDVETPTLSLLYAWSDSFDPPLSGPMPSAVLGLGENLITLVVNDGQIDSAPDMVTVNVVDTTRPDLVASLTLVGEGDDNGDDDEGRFRIGVTAGDVCDSEPTVTAVLDIEGCPDISVADGQIIEFEFDDDECEVEWEDGILEIEAPALVLVATVIDGSGNTDEVVVLPMGLSDDNDNVAAADLDD